MTMKALCKLPQVGAVEWNIKFVMAREKDPQSFRQAFRTGVEEGSSSTIVFYHWRLSPPLAWHLGR